MTYTSPAMDPIARGVPAAPRRSPRGALRLLAAAGLAALLLPAPARADRRDQKAADLYTDAVSAIEKKKYREAAKLLQDALARGATEPNEQQGSQSRYLVYQYDPYYWLGVAFMELKEDDKALVNFEKSESYGVIRKWGPMHQDLLRRKDALEKRSAPVVAAATPPPPTRAPAPTPTAPVVVAAATPVPTPPLVIRIADARTPAPTPAPAGQPAPPVDLEGLRALEREVAAWLAEPDLPPASRPLLEERQKRVASLLKAPPGRALPPNALADERKAMREKVLPAVRRDCLASAIDNLLAQRWTGVDRGLALAGRAEPGAPQVDLLRAVALGTRYLLGQKREAALRDGARGAFSAWRAKVGAARPLPGFVSPALAGVLQ